MQAPAASCSQFFQMIPHHYTGTCMTCIIILWEETQRQSVIFKGQCRNEKMNHCYIMLVVSNNHWEDSCLSCSDRSGSQSQIVLCTWILHEHNQLRLLPHSHKSQFVAAFLRSWFSPATYSPSLSGDQVKPHKKGERFIKTFLLMFFPPLENISRKTVVVFHMDIWASW